MSLLLLLLLLPLLYYLYAVFFLLFLTCFNTGFCSYIVFPFSPLFPSLFTSLISASLSDPFHLHVFSLLIIKLSFLSTLFSSFIPFLHLPSLPLSLPSFYPLFFNTYFFLSSLLSFLVFPSLSSLPRSLPSPLSPLPSPLSCLTSPLSPLPFSSSPHDKLTRGVGVDPPLTLVTVSKDHGITRPLIIYSKFPFHCSSANSSHSLSPSVCLAALSVTLSGSVSVVCGNVPSLLFSCCLAPSLAFLAVSRLYLLFRCI